MKRSNQYCFSSLIRYSKFFLLLLTFISIGRLSAQELVTFPATDSIPHNDDFSVKVRVPGGQWQDLYEYEVQVDMHKVQKSSIVTFDFKGTVEVSVTCNKTTVKDARIRPLSYQMEPLVNGNTINFTLSKPCNLSLEVNGDIFHNLHIFTNLPETDKPSAKDTSIIYFAPGFHTVKGGVLSIPSGKTLYLAGGAVLKAKLSCVNVKNVRICGRGIIYKPSNGGDINYSSDVKVEDLIFINPRYNTLTLGQSSNISIKNIRSFSSQGWGDGIDLFCCDNVLVEGLFMRNSDDCIAVYCHRWDFYGDCKNVIVRNSSLWADVAHPILIGTHGNPEPGKGETLENMIFSNIDILNQDELQLDYQGCMSINVSDGNRARNIRFEDIRVEDIELGQLFNLRVAYNKKYAKAPGSGIENILFKNITYKGTRANISLIQGYDESHAIKNIVFENLNINGQIIKDGVKKRGYMQLADVANIFIGTHVEGVEFRGSEDQSLKK
ncbi:MAG: glycosyl hydrolase family 28 protein [Bacteroidales bacterium]|nr:glycosyl hydrolase family 28 protein [Bacteroidales bacterium]